jgi:single-strand DNA-binding protein
MSVNRVILLGRLGSDVELKYTPAGKPVCNFTFATSEKFKDDEKVSWHKVVAWNKTAELCNQYLKKGSQCLIEGKIDYRSWDDKEGVKRYMTEIIVSSIQFLGSSNSQTQEQDNQYQADDWE